VEARLEICSHDVELNGSLSREFEREEVEVSLHLTVVDHTWKPIFEISRSIFLSSSSVFDRAATLISGSLFSIAVAKTSRK
jgi:hypothetical protein